MENKKGNGKVERIETSVREIQITDQNKMSRHTA